MKDDGESNKRICENSIHPEDVFKYLVMDRKEKGKVKEGSERRCRFLLTGCMVVPFPEREEVE